MRILINQTKKIKKERIANSEFELANGWKKEWNWSEQTEAMKFDEAGNKQSQEWMIWNPQCFYLFTMFYRVMLGDKGFEPMNTVIIIFFLNFELYFNHEHKINLFTKLILWNQRYLRIS